ALWLTSAGDLLRGEVHAVAAYLEVLGGLYSIMLAFVIFVVWDQFNRVQLGVAREASALEDLCRVGAFLSDRDSATRVRSAAKDYITAMANDEPGRLAAAQSSAVAQAAFAGVCRAVRISDIKTEKDAVTYDELLQGLRRLGETRDERLSVSVARIPPTLWSMVIFCTLLLVFGFLVLDLHSTVLSLGVVAAVAGTLTFSLSVGREMDNPSVGAFNVSYEPL